MRDHERRHVLRTFNFIGAIAFSLITSSSASWLVDAAVHVRVEPAEFVHSLPIPSPSSSGFVVGGGTVLLIRDSQDALVAINLVSMPFNVTKIADNITAGDIVISECEAALYNAAPAAGTNFASSVSVLLWSVEANIKLHTGDGRPTRRLSHLRVLLINVRPILLHISLLLLHSLLTTTTLSATALSDNHWRVGIQ